MALKGPSAEDLVKIHNEVNQIVNQRFILTTIAVTIFGVGIAWIIPKEKPTSGSDIGGMIFALSIFLCIIFFSIYLFHALLKGTMRIFTTYLIITEKSGWEKDFVNYRAHSPYTAYSKPQTIVFLILNAATCAFPLILKLVYSINLAPKRGLCAMLIIGFIIEFLMWGMGFKGWFDSELKAKDKWEMLAK